MSSLGEVKANLVGKKLRIIDNFCLLDIYSIADLEYVYNTHKHKFIREELD